MTEHRPHLTCALTCGCIVFLRRDEPVGRSARRTEAGEPLVIRRICPLHGAHVVVMATDNADGCVLIPNWLRSTA